MHLKLDFNMDNAWFEENDAHAAAGETLADVARLVSRGVTAGVIKDGNGNSIGTFAISSRYRTAEAARKAAETRKKNLSPERRREIAKKAAAARWGDPKMKALARRVEG